MDGLISYPLNHVERDRVIRHAKNYGMPDYLLNPTLIDSHTTESIRQMKKDNKSLFLLRMQKMY